MVAITLLTFSLSDTALLSSISPILITFGRIIIRSPDALRPLTLCSCDCKILTSAGPDGIPFGAYRCAQELGSQFLCNDVKYLLEGGSVPEHFAERRTVFIHKTSDIDDNGRIIRSPDALRPLTLCNCDCKLLTSAICRGLRWYTMRCIHPSQRCISSRHNIFEIETTALVHVACSPQESGILLTDFSAAFPSVKHTWILSVIEKTELLDFLSRFLRSFSNDSTTHVNTLTRHIFSCFTAHTPR